MESSITYRTNRKLTADEFIDVLQRSTLAERRPVEDRQKIQAMLDHASVLITAWAGETLVGVSRALTDFSFCCYLSDLAVDEAFQKQGLGKQLITETHLAAGLHTTLILLAAPKAATYYPKIGMEQFTDCFLIRKKSA